MMTKLSVLEGVIPAAPVMYTDATCATLDYDACRDHLRFLLRHEIGAVCVGGHAGETECLTMDERLKVIDIAMAESRGRVPILGGVIADSTWAAIEQVRIQKERGVDGVLVCAPTILSWDAAAADEMLVAHFATIDREGRLPFVIYGGPGAGEGSTTRQLPATFTKIASRCEHLVAWKIPIRGVMTGKNSLEECVQTLAAAGRTTQRTVSPLVAGDFSFLSALKAGAKGNVNSNESVRVDDNTAIYKAFREGDLATAQQLQDRGKRLSDVIYGIGVGRSYTFFHYRGKIAAWMLGHITNPFMRLPQVPPPADEIQMIYDALVASGKKPVREAGEFEHAARSFRADMRVAA